MCFHRLSLHATSMAGSVRISAGHWILPLGNDRTAQISLAMALVDRTASSEVRSTALDWSQDGGAYYLWPVMVSLDGALFGGFIDSGDGTIVIQAVVAARRRDALAIAFQAALFRSQADRAWHLLPASVHPAPEGLAKRLDMACSEAHEPLLAVA